MIDANIYTHRFVEQKDSRVYMYNVKEFEGKQVPVVV